MIKEQYQWNQFTLLLIRVLLVDQVVSNPISLSDMSAAAKRNGYASRSEAEEDMQLVVSNAELYNQPGSMVRQYTVQSNQPSVYGSAIKSTLRVSV